MKRLIGTAVIGMLLAACAPAPIGADCERIRTGRVNGGSAPVLKCGEALEWHKYRLGERMTRPAG
ncbi:MAG TPA: hypothetical protein VEH84_06660 [Alphaproteobacteria bacterium]|nr:hypothetical protein [Alphaproteobacteria bacterium]